MPDAPCAFATDRKTHLPDADKAGSRSLQLPRFMRAGARRLPEQDSALMHSVIQAFQQRTDTRVGANVIRRLRARSDSKPLAFHTSRPTGFLRTDLRPWSWSWEVASTHVSRCPKPSNQAFIATRGSGFVAGQQPPQLQPQCWAGLTRARFRHVRLQPSFQRTATRIGFPRRNARWRLSPAQKETPALWAGVSG